MAIISDNTFDPFRKYVSVRLQQGVPIVDADWNEMEDMRRYELRAFLRWFIGNGVPAGNDGFRVDCKPGLANDFFIRAGITGTADALTNVGRCLVDGLDVLISTDTKFTEQKLHESQPDADMLSRSLNVPKIAKLTTPISETQITIYIDVWEYVVTAAQDSSLILKGLAVESAARKRRDWVIRWRTGDKAPAPHDSDYLDGHSYYALAVVLRHAGVAELKDDPGTVTDTRRQGLSLAELTGTVRSLLPLPSKLVGVQQLLDQLVAACAKPEIRAPTRRGTELDPAHEVAVPPAAALTIYGRNFNVSPDTIQVTHGTTTLKVESITVDRILATVPDSAPSSVEFVSVTSVWGQTSSTDQLRIARPPALRKTPSEFDPASGPINTEVFIYGQDLDTVSKITFVGEPPSTLVIDAARLTTFGWLKLSTQVPAGLKTGEKYKISITTSRGSVTSATSFTVT